MAYLRVYNTVLAAQWLRATSTCDLARTFASARTMAEPDFAGARNFCCATTVPRAETAERRRAVACGQATLRLAPGLSGGLHRIHPLDRIIWGPTASASLPSSRW
eukprot:5752440-Pleurochrysis_carterae.AAC.3